MNLFIKKITSEKETHALLIKSFEEVNILQILVNMIR